MAAQAPDIVIFKGKQMDLYSNPLEQYWITQKRKRPLFSGEVECKRGYVATWKIETNQLFLKDVQGDIKKSNFLFGTRTIKCSLKKLFRRPNAGGVKALWFSGKLRIPNGPMTRFDDNDYDSRFEKEIILTFDSGNLVKTVTLDNSHQVLIVNPILG